MTRRRRRKSDYEKFVKTVAPDLLLSPKILHTNYPGYDTKKSFFANTAKSPKHFAALALSRPRPDSERLTQTADRLSTARTAGTKYRPRIHPVETKAQALATINGISKRHDAKLDKSKFLLK